MTDEQINKAGEEYAVEFCTETTEEILKLSAGEIRDYFRDAFIKGANLANKHWEEKTRWIPVTERLPERITQNTTISRQVITKIENMGYRIKQYDLTLGWVPIYVNEKVISWREIE